MVVVPNRGANINNNCSSAVAYYYYYNNNNAYFATPSIIYNDSDTMNEAMANNDFHAAWRCDDIVYNLYEEE